MQHIEIIRLYFYIIQIWPRNIYILDCKTSIAKRKAKESKTNTLYDNIREVGIYLDTGEDPSIVATAGRAMA